MNVKKRCKPRFNTHSGKREGKELSAQSETFAQLNDNKQVKWKDILERLKDGRGSSRDCKIPAFKQTLDRHSLLRSPHRHTENSKSP